MTRFSVNPRRISEKTIRYVCRDMLELGEWRPDLINHDDTWESLSRCGSLLEIMYVIGAYHYMEQAAHACGLVMPPATGTRLALGESRHLGIWFMEPWNGFGWGGGPSAMTFIPQYPIGPYYGDFGLVLGNNNGDPCGKLYAILEINGFAVHRKKREQDERRALAIERMSAVPVLHFFEETDDPLLWFQHVISHYHGEATG